MKKLMCILLVLALGQPALAFVEGRQVLYVGGTAVGLQEGTIGSFDATPIDYLAFESAAGRLQIPYASVKSFAVSEKLARRMGVLATVVVVILKHRRRRHFVTIEFRDAAGANQAVVFEISKEMTETMRAVLSARVPLPCRRGNTPVATAQPCRAI